VKRICGPERARGQAEAPRHMSRPRGVSGGMVHAVDPMDVSADDLYGFSCELPDEWLDDMLSALEPPQTPNPHTPDTRDPHTPHKPQVEGCTPPSQIYMETPAPPRPLPPPPFKDLEGLKHVEHQVLLHYNSAQTLSKSNIQDVEVLSIICQYFFNSRILLELEGKKGINPRLPPIIGGLKTFFAPRAWEKAREKREILPGEQPKLDGGGGQYSFVLRKLKEWCTACEHPHANLLLEIISEPSFREVLLMHVKILNPMVKEHAKEVDLKSKKQKRKHAEAK